MAKDDWFRNACLTGEAMDIFEERLKHSRSSRPEYMRIQAGALRAAGACRQAIEMLDRLLREYPEHLAAWLYEDRAECHRQLGESEEAIRDYIQSISIMKREPGVRGNAPRRLASFAYEEGRTDLFEQCLDYLADFWDPNPIFPREELHQFGWTAILLHALGKLEDAQPPARRALAAAAKTQSKAANHRNLGLAQPSDRSMLKKLHQIAGGRPFAETSVDARALIRKLRGLFARDF